MKKQKKQSARQFKKRLAGIALLILLSIVLISAFKARSLSSSISILGRLTGMSSEGETTIALPELDVELLTPNKYSRPQTSLNRVNAIVIHYVANPGSTARANRDYFESLGNTGKTSASSHFVIDMDGTIVQCIPTSEISYASNNRNKDSISIEVCHPDASGKFTEDSVASLEKLVSWLLDKYNLDKDDIIRHYDVSGKLCPKYYVEHEDAWEELKDEIWSYYQSHK